MDNGKSKIITNRIKVYGIVQGVGFRPLVYRIANKLNINGTVRNVGGYVEIIAQASEEDIRLLLQELSSGKGGGYEVVKIETEKADSTDFLDFNIIGSSQSDEVSILPPDLPVCDDCREELFDQTNRRYENPFISCMSCGPRYTILEELPYDRHTTTMNEFAMCSSCQKEYTTPEDRRFHAQTISCNDCGPYLIYHDCKKKDLTNPLDITIETSSEETLIEKKALDRTVRTILAGGIMAVKGIGGYHLVCSPFHEESVNNLRKLKGREEKPFALMFYNLEQLKEYCLVSEEEKALLMTKARPIVLLYMHHDIFAPSTNKGSIYCGSFLPYTPLQLLLTKECGPLIMTSANLSDWPIIKEDDIMLSLSSPYLDGVLYNSRRIVRSVDDSVAKIIDGKPQLIRRSRGYVPYPVFMETYDTPVNSDVMEHVGIEKLRKEPVIFAAGGDLKAAFCLYHNGSAVVSQYFGDLAEVTVMDEYKKSFTDLSRLLKLSPSFAVCDLHPNYYSVDFTKNLGIPILQVQHHHAHIASVIAEHDLKGKVIGVSFDGTGYGTDGNIWGGEFMICDGFEFVRGAHLRYSPMLGGDESMKDALKTATCYLLNAGLEDYVSDDNKEIIKAALNYKINTVLTSSIGRLFDAVSSILGICQKNRYEGECAALLEREAVLALRTNKKPIELSFAISKEHEIIEVNPKPVLQALCKLRGKVDTGSLALGFHYALAAMIVEVCDFLKEQYHTNVVALSGGVFQNTVLTEAALKLLRQKNYEVYVNLAVPPNDGGISLGQTYIGLRVLRNGEQKDR